MTVPCEVLTLFPWVTSHWSGLGAGFGSWGLGQEVSPCCPMSCCPDWTSPARSPVHTGLAFLPEGPSLKEDHTGRSQELRSLQPHRCETTETDPDVTVSLFFRGTHEGGTISPGIRDRPPPTHWW